jgi:ferritin-like metal-binding protein YciE
LEKQRACRALCSEEEEMGLFSKPIKSLDDLFLHTLKDIYYAENQIVKSLPKMIEKASDPALKSAFQTHLSETKGQVTRLEQVFQLLGEEAKGVTCAAIDGILDEAKEVMSDIADPSVLDAGMLSGAQAVEHYEITRYGTLIAFARRIGRDDCARIFETTLAEEKETDRKLSALAEAQVNRKAA